MRRLILASALVLALAGPAGAQVVTDIAADTAAGFATGTSISRVGAVTTIGGGTLAGANLFHSFATFNLGTGDVARWTAGNPGAVANVVNRVTGGGLSTIAGTLDTTALPNANFYFINPAGVLFTQGARLDVPNAAHFSTGADGLTFADGAKFSAVTPTGAFSMAAPESFGFLGGENGLVIDGVGVGFTSAGTGLFLTAPNVGIRATGFTLRNLDLVTTGGEAARISLADPLGTAPLAGDVLLAGPQIFAARTGMGTAAVRVAAGTFTQVGGGLSSTTYFGGDAGDVYLLAHEADITGVVSSDSGSRTTAGNAGTVIISLDALHLHDGGVITSSTFGAGNGGAVLLSADDILVEGDALINSDSFGANSGDGGSIIIDAGRLTVRGGAVISSSANGTGDAGTIQIKADGLLLDFGGVASIAQDGTGDGGTISIEARLLEVRNAGTITSSSFADGNAGTVLIRADRMLLRDDGNVSSLTRLGGSGGGVSVTVAQDLVISDGFISSDTFGTGKAGAVVVDAASLDVQDKGLISSSTFSAGSAGEVTVVSPDITITGGSQVRSQANFMSSGDAGSVSVTVTGRLEVSDGSIISSGSFGGNAGRVSILAGDLIVEAGGIVSRVLLPATGDAGQVVIRAANINLDFGSLISSSTDSVGDAGDVTITATKLTMDRFSNIESGAAETASGNGGAVSVTTDTLNMKGTSSIITSTFSSGDAGELQIAVRQAVLQDGSNLSSRAGDKSTGRAGSIDYRGTSLQLTSGAQISTSTGGPGDAGDIRATVDSIVLGDRGGFASNADAVNGGRSGSITIGAGTLAIDAGGFVETNSANSNDAGDISIVSGGPVMISGQGAHIASENLSAAGGAAGSIAISGAPIRLADGGFISTNAATGAAGDISLFLPRDSYLVLEGAKAGGTITTSSGPGTGGRIVISNPLAVISNGGRILALGQQRGANVQIQSDVFIRSPDRVNLLSVDGDLVLDSQVSDVSAGVSIPDVSFLDASGVLRGQCPAARSGGITSQLSLRAYGPYAPAPPPPASDLHLGGATRPGGCS